MVLWHNICDTQMTITIWKNNFDFDLFKKNIHWLVIWFSTLQEDMIHNKDDVGQIIKYWSIPTETTFTICCSSSSCWSTHLLCRFSFTRWSMASKNATWCPLLFFYVLYGSNASCLRAGPDLLTKNRFNLPPLPQLGRLMRVTWPF